ncbi:hypothetical protein [Paenibacillus sp. 276b]|uniref:hypothetical protein n=1 Tax=Paenibacillus sp. 276b TaxID=1566277 RepID=UPI000895F7CA|nr:hypothetical protein [Paenibacillus sp. 276b]SEB27998.1 hypothetical protein SAMN03159332_0083 [Paenibacillus sp. 276b]
MKKLLSSFLCLVFISTLVSSAIFADNSSSYYDGYEILSTTEGQIELDNGLDGTYTRVEIKGTAEDLEQLISKLNNEGHSIMKKPEINEDEVTPMLGFGEGQWRGTLCDRSFEDLWMCNYPIINFSWRLGGLTGAAINGNVTSQITGPAKVYTNMKTTPRARVIGYGLTGRDSFVIGTYDFKSTNNGTLVSWDFDEIAAGVFVYVELFGGADYSFNEYGIARSKTIWAPLVKQ